MADEGWPFWRQTFPGFAEFWQFLEGLTQDTCPGCRAGGGDPGCRIRRCARERGVDLCLNCPDFACEHVEALAARYPTLLADNRRLRALGLAHWLAEQEERVRRGVVYADSRYPGEAAE
jgi:hypothetical protein